MPSIFAPIFLAILAISVGTAKADEYGEATEELLKILDTNEYNKDVMPSNDSGPTEVRLQMLLRNVEVNDADMTTTVEMTFRMLWNDNRLGYSTAGVDYVNFVDTYKLWLPDPFFKNAIDTTLMSSVHPEAYVRITSQGDITYSTRLRLTLRCKMDLSRFPHDQQVCPIQVASYAYSTDYVSFELDQDITHAVDLMYRSRFTFDGFTSSSCESTTKTGTYSCVQVDMMLDRVSSTYSMEFYIPFIFLVIVAFFSEIIPAGALLPRLLLTLVPLVTLATFYFAYSLSLPAVPYARASDIFAGISMLVNFALVIHTIVAYYRSLIEIAEKRRDPEGGEESTEEGKDVENDLDGDGNKKLTKWQALQRKLSPRFDFIYRVFVIGFYVAFLFFYFAAYNV